MWSRSLQLWVPIWVCGLTGLGLELGCRQPARPATATAPAALTADAGAERGAPTRTGPAADRPQRSEYAHADRDSRPQPHPLRRCFAQDSAQSPPRSLSLLLAESADRFEQGLELARQGSEQSPAGRLAGHAVAPSAPPAAEPAKAAPANTTATASTAAFEAALACAEEALRVDGRSVEALHNRALALQELGQLDLARESFAHALAIDPDDPETLAGAADLYINRLLPSAELSEIGVEYARRGSQRLRRAGSEPSSSKKTGKDKGAAGNSDRSLLGRLLLLQAQGLNDLGRPREALQQIEAAIVASDSVQARYERAMALLELCRFADARRAFSEVIERERGDAWAHYGLALSLEMLGQQAASDKELEQAQHLAPRDFPSPLPVSPAEFRALVDKEVAALTPAQRDDLGRVSLSTAELPDIGDLIAEDPPLSPTILGLFRGLPLPEKSSDKLASRSGDLSKGSADDMSDDEPRAIVLYRKNLLRAVRTREELVEQIRTTLLHELGHLRGEDDAELRARGLE